ncbi:unnamed protein product [Mesocestoides corti]|uniref:SID1 transmembrane family member 1 n=1 Tax=Mesocestoides corti TaxID=53468 RepID=A0A0R3UPI0_MESCO|nr:unnamed protein product [Mesocestoides corti]
MRLSKRSSIWYSRIKSLHIVTLLHFPFCLCINYYVPIFHYFGCRHGYVSNYNMGISYFTYCRTLCPSFIARNNPTNATEQIVVELSSSISTKSLAPFYRLRLDVLHNFLLPLGEVVRLLITPSEPQYFLFSLPDDVDSVVVRARSTDTLCMTVSVQHAKCPVADTLGSVKYSGVYQTVTTRGAIPISKRQENASDFLVVLVLRPEDVDCDGIATGYHYYLPIYGAVGIYVLFYIAAAAIILLYRSYDKQVSYYLGYPSGFTTHTVPRNAPNATLPPPLANFVQFASEDPITCARQPVDGGSSLVLASRASTSASTVVSSTYQLPLHQPRSFFSSSSSFEFNNNDDSTKRLRKSHHQVPLSPLQRSKHHRRTVSYGSTRDTAARRTGSLVERWATCSMLNVSLEAGVVLPMVTQGEGSETNNESRIDIDALNGPKLNKHVG